MSRPRCVSAHVGSLRKRELMLVVQVKAERLVLEANGKDGLLTCSLRLAGIFGFVRLSLPLSKLTRPL